MLTMNTNSPGTKISAKAEELELELDGLAIGAVLEVETASHTYRVVNRGGGRALISGHPRFCPSPVLALIADTLVPGMRMQFEIPLHGVVATSPIQGVRILNYLVC
jgi:hypothetical protein